MKNTIDITEAGFNRSTRNIIPTRKPKAAPVAVSRPRQKSCKAVAKVIGGIATGLVILSVWHLTAGIAVLTGSHIMLALLLAVGIDLGLISSELAELVAHGNNQVRNWARAYMVIATVLSIFLNAYEFSAHAPTGALTQSIAIGFGILLPVMIFILARIAAHLYETR